MITQHYSKGLSWVISWTPFLSPTFANKAWEQQRPDTPSITLTILEPASGGGEEHHTPAQSVCRYMSAAQLQEIAAYIARTDRQVRGLE